MRAAPDRPEPVEVTLVDARNYYREDGLNRPETGNVLISIPTFATANPAGSFVAHVSQHVAAVTHAYESRIFLPPVTKS